MVKGRLYFIALVLLSVLLSVDFDAPDFYIHSQVKLPHQNYNTWVKIHHHHRHKEACFNIARLFYSNSWEVV